MSRRRSLAVAAVLLAGCGAPLRFVDRPPLWRERDDAPVATPRPRDSLADWASVRNTMFLPLDRALGLEYGVEAEDVNSLDEVPDSSWYEDPRRDPEDPAGPPRELGAERLQWGAVRADDVPEPPLVVVKGKAVGKTAGFVVEDRRGVRYLLKLDPIERAGLATATEVVVTRLAWACGWRVPAEMLIRLRRDQLSVSPKATVKDRDGRARPFVEADVDAILAAAARRDDGSYHALASRWLAGESLGPFAYDGTRSDDPNDTIPHEHRRSLRGFGVFASWVNEVDALENNTLDMYVGPRGAGHVVHYQQDVGGSFGVWAAEPAPYWMGHEAFFDPLPVTRTLLSLGLWPRPWATERARRAHELLVDAWPELGGFEADDFVPRRWRPGVPNPAFSRLTPRDRYWAAKRIAAFSEDELRGAIAAGDYRPAVAERLFEILWERRRRILASYFGDVTPIDRVRFVGARLCFEDLWVQADLGGRARYRAETEAGAYEFDAIAGGVACTVVAPRDGYRVVSLEARRADRRSTPPVRVHFVESGGARRIVGIER